jgi:hypothetical protein
MPAMVAAGAARRGEAPDTEETWQAPEQTAVARQGVAGATDPEAQAAILMRATGGQLTRAGGVLLRLQQAFGNRHVKQVVHRAVGTVHPAPVVQPSLVLGKPHDRYEQEADQVARQVAGPAGRRSAGGHGGTRAGAVDPMVERAIRGAPRGRPLPDGVRAPLEGLLGADLPEVRVHADARADQLARVLGARAFTTGREIFFRRGEYRPSTQAGQRLLAHELAHTVQQAATAPAATAGVVQRVMIDGYETEKPEQLQELIKLAQSMNSLQQINDMLAKAAKAGAERGPAEPGLGQLLGVLNRKQKVLAYKQTLVPRVKPTSTEEQEAGGPPARDIVPEAPSRSEDMPVSSPEPPAPAPEIPAKDPVVSPEPPTELSPMESLTAEATMLMEWGARLDLGPGAGVGAVETWFKDIEEFHRTWGAWTGKLEATPMGFSERRRLAKPLREYGLGLYQKRAAYRVTTGEQERQEKEQGQALRSEREAAAIAAAPHQVATGKANIDQYVKDLDFSVDGQSVRQPQESIPALFVQWIFISAFGQAAARSASNPSVADLLGQLQQRKAAGTGLWAMVAGTTTFQQAAGQANEYFVKIFIRMPSDPLKLLVGDDSQNRADREALVTETASSFIHEASHSLQEFVYKNRSYPWRDDRSEISSPTFGVRPEDLPEDVGLALTEFVDGGRVGQAKKDSAWVRFNKLLHDKEYYEPPHPVLGPETGGTIRNTRAKPKDPPRKKDIRAKELVSYLMELRYAWNDDTRFREIFPRGAILLDRVITRHS